MTDARRFDDDEGDFGQWKPTGLRCPTCDAESVYRAWESHDGSYEDYQYRCENGHIWWIDGIDA